MHLDPELAAVFRAESEEYVKALTEGFLALESGTGPPGLLDELFRAAHRFKGAARVLGADGLESVTHRLEDLLETVRAKPLTLGPRQFDRLSILADGLAQLVDLTLSGEEANPLATHLMDILEEGFPHDSGGPVPAALPQAVSPAPEAAPETRTASPPGTETHLRIETLRVSTAKLDELLNLSGELLACHQRIQHHTQQAETLADRAEESHLVEPRPLSQNPFARDLLALAQELRDADNRLDSLLRSLQDAIRRTRLVPLSWLWDQVPKWVRDLSRATGKEVALQLEGGSLEIDKQILEGLKDPLLHVIRNAVDHGLETPEDRQRAGKPVQGHLRVSAALGPDHVTIGVSDDGRGLDPEAIRKALVSGGKLDGEQAGALDARALIQQLFRPGVSTRAEAGLLSGRGVGLDLVRTRIEALKGTVDLEATPGQGVRVTFHLPLSLITTRMLVVEVQGLRLGLPAASVQRCLRLEPAQRFPLEGREGFLSEGEPVLRLPLAQVLTMPPEHGPDAGYTVVVRHHGEPIGFGVHDLVGEQEVLQKPLPRRLSRLDLFSGVALLGDGQPCLILDPARLLARGRQATPTMQPMDEGRVGLQQEPVSQGRILVVDDSLTTRLQLSRVLESEGFTVILAVDGLDAWSKLVAQPFDALVSDVDMPGLNGFALTERVRATRSLAELPVVLVTGLSDPVQQRQGLEAGANAYLLKARFDQKDLVETLHRLV